MVIEPDTRVLGTTEDDEARVEEIGEKGVGKEEPEDGVLMGRVDRVASMESPDIEVEEADGDVEVTALKGLGEAYEPVAVALVVIEPIIGELVCDDRL